MKEFKKICGFLCVGIIGFTISGVKASTGSQSTFALIDFPQNAIIKNGEISFEVGVDRYTDYIPGDIDRNGDITLEDAKCVLQSTLSTPCTSGADTELTEEEFIRIADVNGDNVVTTEDAQLILEMALGIQEHYSPKQFSTDVETSDIKSLKYMIVNGDSELYSYLQEYSSLLSDLKTSYENNNGDYNAELLNNIAVVENRLKELVKENGVLSSDKKTINGFIGNKQVDELYVITYLTLEDGYENFDIVSYTDFGLSESGWKAQVEAYNKNYSSASSTVTEETVENPDTVVVISVIGLAIIAIAGTLVAKKKNLFSRI